MHLEKEKKTQHYFSKKPKTVLKITRIQTEILANHLDFETPSGVFGVGKFDNGSTLMIKKSLIPKNAKILDLGCGYGYVGISIAKARKDVNMIMSDINERAVKFSKKNCKLNHLENDIDSGRIKIISGDLFEPFVNKETSEKKMFDVILTNPPFHAGRKICLQIIEESKAFLNKGGSLQLVARHQKGGKVLMKFMEEIFGNVKAIGKGGGFRVYYSENTY